MFLCHLWLNRIQLHTTGFMQKLLLVFVIANAIGALTMTDTAFAADYSVAYALEADGKTETGKIESCHSVGSCRIKFHAIDATAELSYFAHPTDSDKIVLSMWGDSACCYFGDGNDTISLDPTKQLHAVAIYAGHARRRNEFIQNQRLGVLYLSFAVSH